MAAMTDHTNYLFFSVGLLVNEKTETAKLVSEAASKREAERGSGICGRGYMEHCFWIGSPVLCLFDLFNRLMGH
jgi:hypothetical protein